MILRKLVAVETARSDHETVKIGIFVGLPCLLTDLSDDGGRLNSKSLDDLNLLANLFFLIL
jgi:hypothetical protein